MYDEGSFIGEHDMTGISDVRTVDITYHSNYNGLSIVVNENFDISYHCGGDVDNELIKLGTNIADKVVEFASESCDDDGEFYGNINKVEQLAVRLVREAFGDNIEITFEEDSVSS